MNGVFNKPEVSSINGLQKFNFDAGVDDFDAGRNFDERFDERLYAGCNIFKVHRKLTFPALISSFDMMTNLLQRSFQL